MDITQYIALTTILSAVGGLLGWLLKARLDNSVKHEFDKVMLKLQSIEARQRVLYDERLKAFQELSKNLNYLRRYCNAKSAEIRNESEFEATTESLNREENISLLLHSEKLERLMDEYDLFFPVKALQNYESLRNRLGLGFNLELYLASGQDPLELSASSLYDCISQHARDVQLDLRNELGFDDKSFK